MQGSAEPIPEQSAQEALLAAIVESSDDAIIGKDLNGIITSWNKGAERMFGYTAEEIIGQPVSRLAPPDRTNEMPAMLERIRRGEHIDHYETIRITKSGELVDISLTVSGIYDEQGRLIGASKIARDIRERKLAVQALAKQSERLVRANADLQQFAYITSHDLQEPLRIVVSCTEMFLSKSGAKLTAEEREWLDLSVNAARRMTAMIKDLLTYARTLDEELLMEPVDTGQVIEWAVNNLSLRIQSSAADIQYDRDRMPRIRGNKIGLLQVFQNLISNALKYRKREAPRVVISAERNDNHWLFAVQDNGIGIDPAYHKRIFGLFQRLHAAEYPGTGIGLALCRRIVSSHGGEIWVESTGADGSTFKFTLPAEGSNERAHSSSNR